MKKSSGMNDYRWLLTCAAGGMLAAATPADAQIIRPGFLPQGQKSSPARTTPMTKSDDVNLKQQTTTIQQPSQAAKIIPVGNNSIQEELEKLYRESGREMPAMTLESATQQTSPNYQRPGQTPGSSVAAPAGSQPAPAAPATNWYAPGAAPANLPPSGTPAVPATATPTAQPTPAPSGNAVSRFFKRLTPGRKETTPASSQPPVPPGVAQSYPAYQAPSVPPAELMTSDEVPLPSAAPNRLPTVIAPPDSGGTFGSHNSSCGDLATPIACSFKSNSSAGSGASSTTGCPGEFCPCSGASSCRCFEHPGSSTRVITDCCATGDGTRGFVCDSSIASTTASISRGPCSGTSCSATSHNSGSSDCPGTNHHHPSGASGENPCCSRDSSSSYTTCASGRGANSASANSTSAECASRC